MRQSNFATDIDTTLVDWLTDYFEDLQGLIAQKKSDESAIADAQTGDMTTWLESHVQDLSAALQEVCQQEHAYNYNPPGFYVDTTVADLAAFQRLSEKFELMVVQLVGTFEAFV